MSASPLTVIDHDLWCLDSHFVTWGCRGSTRMTVIRTARGLTLYSPVAMAPGHVAQIRALGNVSAIVAPNLFHHLFLRPAIASFPDARVFVPRGLEAKIGPIDRACDMTKFNDAPDLAARTATGHRLNEGVLFHAPTGTLITADLLYNFQAEHFRAEKLFFGSIGCYGKPCVAGYHRLAVRNKAALRLAIDGMAAWPVRRIIMSHGRIIEGDDAAQVFAEAWRKIL